MNAGMLIQFATADRQRAIALTLALLLFPCAAAAQGGERHVHLAAGHGQRGQGSQGQDGRERYRTGLQVWGRGEQRRHDGCHHGRVKPILRW